MGSLHKGHLSLVASAKRNGDVSVVSIFVNPSQFGPKEDYATYPRDLEKDLRALHRLGVDVVFTPTSEEMYPEGFETYVEVCELQRRLCGISRPGHFRGVATVVLKLFNIVKPHAAVFGEKDYQQLRIIKKMVRDLALDIDIIAAPTVREENGLAMSSRNRYLSDEDRSKALGIPMALMEIKREFENGTRDAKRLISIGKELLKEHEINRIDYLNICDRETLEDKAWAEKGDVVAIALNVGSARLIDNMTL